MNPVLCSLFILTLLFCGCEAQQGDSPPKRAEPAKTIAAGTETTSSPSTYPLLQDSTKATVMELPTQALPLWQKHRKLQPTLVLLSQDPFLQPIPPPLMEEAMALIREGGEEITQRLAPSAPNPVLLPQMALNAALEAGLFSGVVWIFPSPVEEDQLNVETFRQQMLDFGAVDEKEAESFALTDGIFSGTVRGVPFQAAHPEALPAIDGPVLLHIDLGYLSPLYQGEVKTPLFPLLYTTLSRLKEKSWQAAEVSVSLSNFSIGLPLATRFLGGTLSALFRDPSLLQKPLAENWNRRSQALYLENFFQKEKVREIYLAMEEAEPAVASVKYALYQLSRQFKEGAKALEYLKKAVSIDRAYALEYLALADVALEKNLPDEALGMLQLTQEALPDDPFISLRLARLHLALGHAEKSREIIGNLRDLPWSSVYYPAIPVLIEELPQSAKNIPEGRPG